MADGSSKTSQGQGAGSASGRVERVIGRRTSERILVNGQPAIRTTTESYERPLGRDGPMKRITSTEVTFNLGVPSGIAEGGFGGDGDGDEDDDTDDVDDVALATNPSGPSYMGLGSHLGLPSDALSRAEMLGGMISAEQFPRGISTELMSGPGGMFVGGGASLAAEQGAARGALGSKSGTGGVVDDSDEQDGGHRDHGPPRKRSRRQSSRELHSSPGGGSAANEEEAMLLTSLNGGASNGIGSSDSGKRGANRGRR